MMRRTYPVIAICVLALLLSALAPAISIPPVLFVAIFLFSLTIELVCISHDAEVQLPPRLDAACDLAFRGPPSLIRTH